MKTLTGNSSDLLKLIQFVNIQIMFGYAGQ